MIEWLLRDMASLSAQTRILEVLGWDDELLDTFSKEFSDLLDDAPEDPVGLMFLLKSVKWECFEGEIMPPALFESIKQLIFSTQHEVDEMMNTPEN